MSVLAYGITILSFWDGEIFAAYELRKLSFPVELSISAYGMTELSSRKDFKYTGCFNSFFGMTGVFQNPGWRSSVLGMN